MTIYLGCIKMPLTGSLRKQDEEYDVKIYADCEDQWPTWIQLDTAPSEICIILHIIRKPNSIIVLLFIQNMWPWKAKRASTEKPFQLEKRTDIIPVNSKTAYSPIPLRTLGLLENFCLNSPLCWQTRWSNAPPPSASKSFPPGPIQKCSRQTIYSNVNILLKLKYLKPWKAVLQRFVYFN